MCATVSTMFTSALERLLEHVGGVAGGAEADDLERRALVGRRTACSCASMLLRVLDRVALRELVGLLEDLAVLVDEHRLRRGRAAVEADDAAHDLPGLERRRRRTSGSCRARGTSSSSLLVLRRAAGPRVSPRRALRPLVMNSSSAVDARVAADVAPARRGRTAPRRSAA